MLRGLLQCFAVNGGRVSQKTGDRWSHGNAARAQVAARRIQFDQGRASGGGKLHGRFGRHHVIFGRNNDQELGMDFGGSLFERRDEIGRAHV